MQFASFQKNVHKKDTRLFRFPFSPEITCG